MPERNRINLSIDGDNAVSKIGKLRQCRFEYQSGKCYYCQQPMWHGDATVFCSTYHVTQRQARRLQATAEHLLARSSGGPDTMDNIVAACAYCNSHRHKAKKPLAPEAYRRKVGRRMATGGWHCLRLAKVAAVT